MARRMRKFADGGSDKYKARYDRKVADINSDYDKWLKSGKYGNASTAAAKRDQRLADAKDDLAKWTGADRTATRAAEKASESALSEARRTKGASYAANRDVGRITAGADEPIKTKVDTSLANKGDLTQSMSFGQAFRAARGSGDKTFMWRGKSYTTKMAGEDSAPKKSAPPASNKVTPNTPKVQPKQDTSPDRVPVFNREALLGKTSIPAAKVSPPASKSGDDLNNRLAQYQASLAKNRQIESGSGSEATTANMKRILGFGSTADESAIRNIRQEQARKAQAAADKTNSDAQQAGFAAERRQRNAAKVAAGNRPGASGWEKQQADYYSKNPDAMKKGGKVKKPVAKKPVKKVAPKKFAKGGSVDGCAIRGKTRAPMKKR